MSRDKREEDERVKDRHKRSGRRGSVRDEGVGKRRKKRVCAAGNEGDEENEGKQTTEEPSGE